MRPSTYKIPVANDMPPVFNVKIYESGVNAEDSILPVESGRRAAADARYFGAPRDRGRQSRASPTIAQAAGLDAPATAEEILRSVEDLRTRSAAAAAAGKVEQVPA